MLEDKRLEEGFEIDEYDGEGIPYVDQVRKLFEASFPLRFGETFYRTLEVGAKYGTPILTCIARQGSKVVGAACACKEDAGGEARVLASGKQIYLMTLAVNQE